MATVAGMLEADPEPDAAIGGKLLPESRERTVTMNLTVMGDDIFSSLWDSEGRLMAQVSVRDASFGKGAPGIRVPALRDGTLRYQHFRVHDLSGVSLSEVAPGVRRNPAVELLVNAPMGASFRIQESRDLVRWNDLELGNGEHGAGVMFSMTEQPRRFFRLMMEEQN